MTYRKDTLLLEQLYTQILQEGAQEDMITNVLTKQKAEPRDIQFFLHKEGGKLLFKPEHVATLYNWLKAQNGDQQTLVQDYKDYQKYFQNVPLTNFENYLDWTEKVHGKRDEQSYQTRHKDIKEIDIEGEDKENLLADDENVRIFKGDSEHKCVKYGRGYSFCISRPGGGNMYGNYRIGKASTFYFIYFKKVPKEDNKHIMVLDRTKDGWEWTFADNKTEKISGGWNDVIKAFPVLAKYESLFVNKKMTKQEEIFQQKARSFSTNPDEGKFAEFSYQEKADVLKLGMLLPLSLFKSLDSFQRNEWISVGPKMTDEIFNLLKENEKKRFWIVRKQQLGQRAPVDKFDVEICKNDPVLYEKYIKEEEDEARRYEQEIKSQIKDGFVGSIAVETTMVDVSFPGVKKARIISSTNKGDRSAEGQYGSISFPDLEEAEFVTLLLGKSHVPKLKKAKSVRLSGEVNVQSLEETRTLEINTRSKVDLPRLTKVETLTINNAPEVNITELTSILQLQFRNNGVINCPKLQTVGLAERYMEGGLLLWDYQKEANFPELKMVIGNIEARKCLSFNAPNLEQVQGAVWIDAAQQIDFRNLTYIRSSFSANSAKTINLPKLARVNEIYATDAQSIELPLVTRIYGLTSQTKGVVNMPALEEIGMGGIRVGAPDKVNIPSFQGNKSFVIKKIREA